jgi:general stress protein 26
MSTVTDTREKVYDILKSFSTAMVVSVGPGGRPEARPMQVAKVEDSGEIWFFTGRGGALATEIEEEAVVLLSFQKDNSSYLSLRGKARNVLDRTRISEFWKEPYRVWFPGGPSDPNIELVAVDPIDAEYWDNRGSNKLEYLFKAAKAYVKGEKPDVEDPDHHAKTSL